MIRRADRAEIARVHDHLDALIGGGHLTQDLNGAVLRRVVDEEVLVVAVGDGGHHAPDLFVDLAHVLFFVEARSEHCHQGHRWVLSICIHRPVNSARCDLGPASGRVRPGS